MKKIGLLVCIVLSVLLVFSACGAGTIVSADAPLCREDFNAYFDGQVVDDPDQTDEGFIYFFAAFNRETARGMKVGDTLSDLGDAYKNVEFSGDIIDDQCLVCSMGDYKLEFKFDNDLKIESITAYNRTGVETIRSYYADALGGQSAGDDYFFRSPLGRDFK